MNPPHRDALAHAAQSHYHATAVIRTAMAKVERDAGYAKETPVQGQHFESLEVAQALGRHAHRPQVREQRY